MIGLPHTVTGNKDRYGCCAFTNLVADFCKMMTLRGHTVIHYGAEGSTPVCTEHVTTVTAAQQARWFKYDWDRGEGFPDVVYERDKTYWVISNARAIDEIEQRIQDGDYICTISDCHRGISEAFPKHASVEYAIGYLGTYAPYRVFCSRAFQHVVYQRDQQENGRISDTVIHHYFDPDDFPLGAHHGDERGEHFAYLGRLITRKGPHLAGMVCGQLGARLVMAGNGVTYKGVDRISSPELAVIGKHIEHIGVAGPAKRAALLGRSTALFVLTQYLGPFEMVAVEAMMCGTPVITTDWGAFPEYVIDGFNGFRVNTIGEAVEAAKRCRKLDHEAIRQWAVENLSIQALAPRYEEFFDRVRRLRAGGTGPEDRVGPWFNGEPGIALPGDSPLVK